MTSPDNQSEQGESEPGICSPGVSKENQENYHDREGDPLDMAETELSGEEHSGKQPDDKPNTLSEKSQESLENKVLEDTKEDFETEDTNVECIPDSLSIRNLEVPENENNIVVNHTREKDYLSKEAKFRLEASRQLSIDLLERKDHQPQDLVVTEKLPEVLLVAEQLPEHLPAATNILSVQQSKELKREESTYLNENINDQDEDFDDGGSTLTIGRKETQSDIQDVLPKDDEREEKQSIRHSNPVWSEENDINESCLSPFFLVLYILLGWLIIILLGLNFWFGFNLILLISLFAVIAFLLLVLTEFTEFHNLSI